jgi:hypothetical protein
MTCSVFVSVGVWGVVALDGTCNHHQTLCGPLRLARSWSPRQQHARYVRFGRRHCKHTPLPNTNSTHSFTYLYLLYRFQPKLSQLASSNMKRVAPSPVKEKASPHKRLIIDGQDMDPASSRSGSPTGGGPLQAATPERINQRRESPLSSVRQEGRDSSVFDKINQFNNLNSLNLSAQSKQLERKTADAALKRAMLGREEAETELRKYRDDVKMLRKALEEGRERERKVGERLETVMVSLHRD